MDKLITIRNLSGKYAKQSLIHLEHIELSEEVFRAVRKIVLDSYADYRREIEKIRLENDTQG